jgi:hypothetical protein
MTAEQYILENFEVNHADKDIQEAMIGFAKYHVEQALKAANKNAEVRVTENALIEDGSCYTTYDDGVISVRVDKDSILSAYPLENIK